MGIQIVLVVLCAVFVAFPWIFAFMLKVFAKNRIRKIKPKGYLAFEDILLVFGETKVQINSVKLKPIRFKFLIEVDGLALSIIPVKSKPPTSTSALKMLTLRLLISILSTLFSIELKTSQISIQTHIITLKSVLLSPTLNNDSGALSLSIYIDSLTYKTPEIQLKSSDLLLCFALPGDISIKSAISNSTLDVTISSLALTLLSIPSSSSEKPPPSLLLPKGVNLNLHKLKVNFLSLELEGYSLALCLNPLQISIALLTGTNSIPAIHIPRLQISESLSNSILIKTHYIGINIQEVLSVIFKLIKPKPQSAAEGFSQKAIVIEVESIEARLPGSQGSIINFESTQISVSSEVRLLFDSVSIENHLKLFKADVAIKDTIEVSLAASEFDLNEDIIKELVSCTAELVRSFPKLPASNSPPSSKKPVKLFLSEINFKGTFPDAFKIYITVDKFTANILPTSFDLYFLNSNIYDEENQRNHIIFTSVCKVHKEYKAGVAEIEVLGDEIGIYLPRKYYLTRAVVKFLKGSHRVYKWCKFAFTQSHKSTTHIPERSNLNLIFKNFKFTAEDNPIDASNIKKSQINPDDNVYSQLLCIGGNPLLTLICKTANVKLNNFELDTMKKIKSAMEDYDNYEIPYDEFFAVVLAYDFSCVGKYVCMKIRDYPYEFCVIKQVSFGGRSILTKNRLLTPVWAQYKHHYDIEVNCSEVSSVAGICMLKVLMDALMILKYIFFIKPSQPSGVQKLDLVDFLRYFLHGHMKITVNSCNNLLLRTSSPYIYEGFHLNISTITIELLASSINFSAETLLFYYSENCILKLPSVQLSTEISVISRSSNHWIIYPSDIDMFADIRSTEINTSITASISPLPEKVPTLYFSIPESSILLDFIKLLTIPPVTLIPIREKSPARFFKNFNKVELKDFKLGFTQVYLITESGDGAILSISTAHLSAICKHSDSALVPWTVMTAEGTSCNLSMKMFTGQDDSEMDLLDCFSLEYGYSNTTNHYFSIEGFKLYVRRFLVHLITDLIISRPVEIGNFKKKREKNKFFAVKSKKKNSSEIMRGSIADPIIIIVNDDDGSQLAIKGGVAEFNVIEETLKYDTAHKDYKRSAKFLMQIIECFVEDDSIASMKIFSCKDIEISMNYFSYPYNRIDFARNCEADDEFMWYKEKRINRLGIDLPEVNASIESEQFWIVTDIVKGYLGFIPKDQVSFSERLMEDEFKIYGGKELVKKFNENSKKISSVKPNELKSVKISLQNLTVSLKRNSATLIEMQMQGIKLQITTYADISCQHSLEIHKILMSHGNTVMISPLLLDSEEYLPSNTMITLRILDRLVKGGEVLWPVIDHLELLVYPLKINFSKEIYKDLYSFFFNEEKAKTKAGLKRIKLPRLYKYVHLNEIKICITVTGWIPLNNAKISLKAFTRQNKFKTLQGVFDRIMKHGLKSIISQVPSICIQNMGISKKNFLPTTEPAQRSKSIFDKLKKKKSQPNLTPQDLQNIEGIKLMFGKNFK